MPTRRRFLAYSSAGILAATAGCRPAHLKWASGAEENSPKLAPVLADKAGLAKLKNNVLGYPLNMKALPEEFFAWRRQLRKVGIGDFGYNNVGNPFHDSAIPFNTHDLERETILRFAKVYGFSPEDTWGFLSHSGTDSNMHGMYMGRTLLKARTGRIPKCYFTRESHYSIQILRDLLGLEAVCVETSPDGGMDPEALERKLAEHRDSPALVVATLGTTFKGAIDPVDRLREVLQDTAHYLHLDAALFGGYLAHTSRAHEVKYRDANNPSAKRYDSIAVSCHKFFGFPSPAGLFITAKTVYDEFNVLYSRIHDPEYIGHVPGTITCSRDAVKPAEFYFFSSPEALSRQAEDAKAILRNTDYLLEEMRANFPQLMPVRANPVSNTLYFRKPGDRVVRKYYLATMHLETGGRKQDYAHVVVMPHADRALLSEFLADLD